MKPGFEEQENPYVGIFPTRDQHKHVMKTILEKYSNQLGGILSRSITDYLNTTKKYWDLNDIIASIRDYNYGDYYIYNEIEKLYLTMGFKPEKTYDSYFGFDWNGTFMNTTTFRYRISFLKNFKITPGIFGMANMQLNNKSNQEIDNYLDTNGISVNSVENGKFISRVTSSVVKSPKVGWTKEQLFEVLSESGIFDTKITPTDTMIPNPRYPKEKEILKYYVNLPSKTVAIYRHEYPNLARIGIPTIYHNTSYISGFDAKNLPKYILERIYHRVFNPILDWEEILSNENIDVESIKIEYLRATGKRLYGDTKAALINRRKLFEELPEMAERIIMQPGGSMYLKYVSTLGGYKMPPKPREISMLDYDFYLRACEDPTKDRFHLTLYAIKLGIGDFVTEKMTKEDICNMIFKQLAIIKESKSL